MTVTPVAGLLLPIFIWAVWLTVARGANRASIRVRLAWAAASIIGILVTIGFAIAKFSEPSTDKDPLSSAISFSALDGSILIASALFSTVLLIVLLFLAGSRTEQDNPPAERDQGSKSDASRKLGDDW